MVLSDDMIILESKMLAHMKIYMWQQGLLLSNHHDYNVSDVGKVKFNFKIKKGDIISIVKSNEIEDFVDIIRIISKEQDVIIKNYNIDKYNSYHTIILFKE